MPYINGRDLTAPQRSKVKAAFVHRSTYEHPRPQYGGEPRMSDAEWIDSHSFNFTKAGHLGRGGARSANPHVDTRHVLKTGQSILAKVKRVGNKLVIQPVERAARRAVKRVRKAVTKRNPGPYVLKMVGTSRTWTVRGAKSLAEARSYIAKQAGVGVSQIVRVKGK